MASKILIDDEWYEVGQAQEAQFLEGGTICLSCTGEKIVSLEGVCPSNIIHPLTPCDPPKAFVLGENVLATVPEKYKDRVTGEYRAPQAGEVNGFGPIDCFTIEVSHGKINPNIIFSPPAEPPKTAEELLADVLNQLAGADGYSFLDQDTQKAVSQYQAAQKQT